LKYELIVIGGGPGGYLAAERAGDNNIKTLVIEKENMGGVCLNEGCIPSKTFLYSAKIFEGISHGKKYGVTAENIKYDQKAVLKRKNKVVKTLVAGVKAKLKKSKVDIINATAKIERKTEEGFLVSYIKDEKKEFVTSDRLIIATGSVPVIPPIDGVKDSIKSGFALTNKEILNLDFIPKSLTVIGGGVIGLEMAAYFNSVGCKVTVIEMLNKIGGSLDNDISEALLNSYSKKGIDFKLNSKVVEVKDNYVVYEEDGQTFKTESEKVLLSIGRRAYTENLGLENIDVETDRGKIKVDNKLMTNIPNVYAIGDVNGILMLAHTAYREAEVCVNNIIGKNDIVRYENIASVVYGNPEVAAVGITEEEAKRRNIEYKKVILPMTYSGRYLAENEVRDGTVKLIADKKYNKLIGIHMMGSYVSEIVYGLSLMLEMEMKIDDMKELVFPHPTVSEVIHEGLFEF
jgi:dihydrolipoamide dehydrogenase